MNLFSELILTLVKSAEWIAIASLKTIPIIILVLIVQRLFRRQLSAAFRHLLWLCVLLSLSIPFGWTLNLGNISNNYSAQTLLTNETLGYEFKHENVITAETTVLQDDKIRVPQEIHSADSRESYRWKNSITHNLTFILTMIWLCGATLFLVVTLKRARYFQRIKIASTKVTPDIISLFNSCKRELGIQQSIQLLSSHNLQSPISLGWIKPAIILPHNIKQTLSPETLKHVLLHELGHIKRQDIFFNWLACLINILHWFNPMVWLACKRMRTDMEIACDALVLKHLDESQRKRYGTTLIEIGETPRISPRASTTLGILENHKELKERLIMIKEFTTMNMKNTLIFSLVLATTTFTALAQPDMQKPQQAAAELVATKTISTTGTSLHDVATRAEKDLKTKVLVGQKDADSRIQVNFGTDTINYGQLLTQLKINEYTAYKSKDYIQIIPIRDARFLAIPTVEKGKNYYEDEVVTDYLKPEKACAVKIMAALRPLVPPYGHLTTFDDNNTLIISDTYGNIQRIKNAIAAIDANLSGVQNCDSSETKKTTK